MSPRPGLAIALPERARLSELLDRPRADEAEVERNLHDLARLNRLPGGTTASVAAIRRLGPGAAGRILDAGAGLGDMARAFAEEGWRTVALDSHRQVVATAGAATADAPLVEVVEGDVRSLAYADGAFDVSHCSLLIHHLDPEDAVMALREMARVARCGVVINDLRRGVVPFVAAGVAVAVLARCRATRVDGLASVRRAYTLRELDELLVAAGLAVRWRSNRLMPRVVTAAVRRSGR